MLFTSIFSFSHNVFKRLLSQGSLKSEWCGKELTLSKQHILHSNGGEFTKRVENTVEKGKIAHPKQFFPFPTVFSEDLFNRHVKTRALGKDLTNNKILDCSKSNAFKDPTKCE